MAEGWFPIVWFLSKTLVFIFFFVWLRGVLPRMRYDAFMRFGWKVLVPSAWSGSCSSPASAATLEVDDRRRCCSASARSARRARRAVSARRPPRRTSRSPAPT
jgi:hypothetical protein